jgi:hypothetical protein
MSKKQEITPFPQQTLDTMFWQYIQGVKDAVEHGTYVTKEEIINEFIAEKLAHIKQMHNGRRPSFDLKAVEIMGKIEIKKTLI